jgi:hypothetical protein
LADGTVVELKMEHIVGSSSFDVLNVSVLIIEVNGLKGTGYNSLVGILQLL